VPIVILATTVATAIVWICSTWTHIIISAPLDRTCSTIVTALASARTTWTVLICIALTGHWRVVNGITIIILIFTTAIRAVTIRGSTPWTIDTRGGVIRRFVTARASSSTRWTSKPITPLAACRRILKHVSVPIVILAAAIPAFQVSICSARTSISASFRGFSLICAAIIATISCWTCEGIMVVTSDWCKVDRITVIVLGPPPNFVRTTAICTSSISTCAGRATHAAFKFIRYVLNRYWDPCFSIVGIGCNKRFSKKMSTGNNVICALWSWSIRWVDKRWPTFRWRRCIITNRQ